MRVEILGTGCARCHQLTRNVQTALERLGAEADVRQVEDPQQILAYGVMSTPALVVDGAVRLAGRVPGPEELQQYLAGPPAPADLAVTPAREER